MKADLKVIGPAAIFPRYIVAGGTAIEAGEPVHSVATYSSGAASANTMVLAAADTPVIGTHNFGGVATRSSTNVAAGTVAEQFLNVATPVPAVGRIRGKAETAANVDTLTELALIIMDKSLIDYSAAGAPDGGQLYTIKDTAAADVNGLTIVGGNTALSTLDVVVDARAYCLDVS
jgi:hypothetical protein